MKKLLLKGLAGIFMLCSVNLLFAQQIPNGGFESWLQTGTFEHPVVSPAPVFTSSNTESFYRFNILTATKVNGISGKALRLENKQAPGGDTLKAYASWGNVNQGSFNEAIPLPGNQGLTGLSLYLRYSLSVTTPGFIGVIPMKNGSPAGLGNGVIEGAYIYPISGTQATFTLANYTFSPALILNPDSCIIVISSSDMVGDEKGTIGDYLEVDQLSWIGNTNTLYGGSLDVWQNVPAIEYPSDWTVSLEDQRIQFAKSADAKYGNYSLELFNVQGESEVFSGRATLGGYGNCNGGGPCEVKPGMKVTNTPKSIGFYYKYNTPGIDTASFYIAMYKGGVNVGSQFKFLLPSSNWKYVNIVLPNPSQTPDSLFISIESGRWKTAVVGSDLKLDGLKLHYCDDASVITGPTSICSGTNGAQFAISEEFASAFAWSTTTGSISGSSTNDTVTINGISAGGTVSVIKTYPDGCPTKQFDYTVSLAATASADANQDQTLCANNACATLNGSVTGATGGVWTSSGTGSFSSSTSLSAVYCASAADTTAGTVTLTLTPTGTGGCSVSSDHVILTFTDAPKVDANIDQTKCGNNAVTTLSGSKNVVASGVEWTTLGSGTFNNRTLTNAIYTPSVNDVQSGFIKLVITTTGHPTCNAVTDTMKITFTSAPTVNAGPDETICNGASVTLAGSFTVVTAGTWSGGTGTFDPNNTTANATYTPSVAERSAGTVTLVFNASKPTCTSVSDEVIITISTCTDIADKKNILKGFKVYPTPTNGVVSLELEEGIAVKEVKVMNSLQQEVNLNSIELNGNKAHLDISGLNSGIYFLRVSDGSSIGVQRIVKE